MGILSWLKKRVAALPEDKEMSFFDHLEELRGHLFRSALLVTILSIGLFIFRNEIMKAVFFAPLKIDWYPYQIMRNLSDQFNLDNIPVTMQALSPYEQFTKALVYSFFGAIILAMPYLLWEIWKFIKPGLKKKEVMAVSTNVLWMSLLFFSGVLFGYYVVLPFSLLFFATFTLVDDLIVNNWRIGEFISFVFTLSLGAGLLFQLPVAVYYLAKIGLISSAFMRKYRRHSIVVIVIVAGILTPPDPFSQIFLAIPMYILFEAGIVVCKRVERADRLKEESESGKVPGSAAPDPSA